MAQDTRRQHEADLFKALADPTRLHMIQLLAKKQRLCVNELAEQLSVSQSAVSQHLRILRQLDLVSSERMGYHIHYQLKHATLATMQSVLEQLMKNA